MTAKRITQVITVTLTIGASLAILLLPSYVTASVDSDGHEVVSAETALAVVGPWILALLAIPNVVAIAPLLARGRAWQPISIVSTLLLTGFGVASMLSLGMYFLPAILASIVAVFLPTRPHPRRR